MTCKPILDDKYLLNLYIGRGGSSNVYYGTSAEGDVAIKVARKDKEFSKSKQIDFIQGEGDILKEVGYHPNIACLLDSNTQGQLISYMNMSEVSYLGLEYCANGTLHDIILKTESLDEDIAKFYFLQLGSSVKHMHDQGFVHLDIKPGNILIDNNFNLKLSDFGGSKKVGKIGLTDQRLGTPGYRAPEICYNSWYDGFLADVYSLGATLYFLLTKQKLPDEELSDVSSESQQSDVKLSSSTDSSHELSPHDTSLSENSV